MSFLTNLFGKTKVEAPPPVTPPGFNAGGLNVSFANNGYNVSADGNRSTAVGNVASTYGGLGDEYGALRPIVAPGFNDMLKARLTDLGNQATAAVGDLRDNLRSRRILGSSFGQDTLNRLNMGINQQRDAIIADNTIKSLAANQQLIGQQYAAYAKQFQTGLDELNLEASVASGLMGKASDTLMQNQKLLEQANEFNAKMSNDQAGGFGGFLGRLALAPVTGGGSLIGNFLGGK